MGELSFTTSDERPVRSGTVPDALVDAIKATLGTEPPSSVKIDVTGKDPKGVKRVMANLSALGRTGRIDGKVRTTHVPEQSAVYAWCEAKSKAKPKSKRKTATAADAPPADVSAAEPQPAEPALAATE